MKFVFTYTTQQGGSEADRHEAAKKAQQLLATWQPSDTASILQWVSRVDGNGGFSVIETDNAENILKDLSTWSSFLDFQVLPGRRYRRRHAGDPGGARGPVGARQLSSRPGGVVGCASRSVGDLRRWSSAAVSLGRLREASRRRS